MNRVLLIVGVIGLAAVAAPALSRACDCHPAQAAPAQTAGSSRVTLNIEGMDCAACAPAVRITLKKLDGVKEAKVDFAQKRADVEYVPSKVTPQQMVAAVNKLGYKATVAGERG